MKSNKKKYTFDGPHQAEPDIIIDDFENNVVHVQVYDSTSLHADEIEI